MWDEKLVRKLCSNENDCDLYYFIPFILIPIDVFVQKYIQEQKKVEIKFMLKQWSKYFGKHLKPIKFSN